MHTPQKPFPWAVLERPSHPPLNMLPYEQRSCYLAKREIFALCVDKGVCGSLGGGGMVWWLRSVNVGATLSDRWPLFFSSSSSCFFSDFMIFLLSKKSCTLECHFFLSNFVYSFPCHLSSCIYFLALVERCVFFIVIYCTVIPVPGVEFCVPRSSSLTGGAG